MKKTTGGKAVQHNGSWIMFWLLMVTAAFAAVLTIWSWMQPVGKPPQDKELLKMLLRPGWKSVAYQGDKMLSANVRFRVNRNRSVDLVENDQRVYPVMEIKDGLLAFSMDDGQSERRIEVRFMRINASEYIPMGIVCSTEHQGGERPLGLFANGSLPVGKEEHSATLCKQVLGEWEITDGLGRPGFLKLERDGETAASAVFDIAGRRMQTTYKLMGNVGWEYNDGNVGDFILFSPDVRQAWGFVFTDKARDLRLFFSMTKKDGGR